MPAARFVAAVMLPSRANVGSRIDVSNSLRAATMPESGELKYLVLADRAVPYLLAKVRWPDVALAISAANPDGLEDPGLFDLPYDPTAVAVSFTQAASVAASWGRQLHPGAEEGVPPYIRRMPANWSDLSPSERRAWGIEFVGTRRASTRRVRRPRRVEAKMTAPRAAAQANGQVASLAGAGEGPGMGAGGPAASDFGQLAAATNGLRSVATERRHETRVRVNGRAHIRSGHTTISAGLVDLSESGMQCVLPEESVLVAPGVTLGGPFLLETEVIPSRICLDVAGQISWYRNTGAGTHFGVAFGELAMGETKGVQRFLLEASGKRGNR
jgi:hypothetical protein